MDLYESLGAKVFAEKIPDSGLELEYSLVRLGLARILRVRHEALTKDGETYAKIEYAIVQSCIQKNFIKLCFSHFYFSIAPRSVI